MKHKDETRTFKAALRIYAEAMAGLHEDECPCDDTCDCKYKWVNDAINAACADAPAVASSPDRAEELAREITLKVCRMTLSETATELSEWAKPIVDQVAALLRSRGLGERWIPVSESKPEYGAYTTVKLVDGSVLCNAIRQGDEDYWWRERFFDESQVSAWLPSPPREEKHC